MVTGYEGYTLSELERKAVQDGNYLAQEILERCIETHPEKQLREDEKIRLRTFDAGRAR